ncbi:DUF6446 family protein [Paracoccus sp. 1_MG-2023]|uniref:DUF6446 family protein n=1 Tax=unclassified Paracoccus (in: a-proteobacteria) TaxID=2688777 RepID=UPI001C080CBF|nr:MULTISPECIES: DUF6446 family protein [unclassified Paracoccus (in: a-proteobacteria)]MBU2958546.1 histidine kinase [Paracoccus sp. C2R09]MDO6667539.1 DUF6446 family protein [Paracoccus sp. 1_MG-2023]
MNGKPVVLTLVLATAIAGGGMWYAQEYGYYDRIDPSAGSIAVDTPQGSVDLDLIGFEGIDADSSPLRWRACARAENLPADAAPYPDATPLIGPRWFDCFDAREIGRDLERGAARAILAKAEIHSDVDRVLAVYPDGRVFGWHQYNDKTPERGVMD